MDPSPFTRTHARTRTHMHTRCRLETRIMWPGFMACPAGPDWTLGLTLTRPGAQSSAADVVRILALGK